MQDKYRNLIYLLMSVAPISWASAPQEKASVPQEKISPFKSERLGKCYANSNQLHASFLLPDGKPDENIKFTETNFGKNLHWIIDKTSTSNFQWYLIESKTSSKCVILYIPFAYSAVGKYSNGVLSIEAKTQGAPGWPSYVMVFRRSAKIGQYVPYECSKIVEQRDSTKAESVNIDCLTVGD